MSWLLIPPFGSYPTESGPTDRPAWTIHAASFRSGPAARKPSSTPPPAPFLYFLALCFTVSISPPPPCVSLSAAAAIRRTDAEKGRDGWPEERGPLQSIRPIIIELSFSIIALFCSLSNAAAKKYLFSILRGLIKGPMRKQELFLVQHGNLFSTPRCMIGMQGYQITFLNIPHILCRCI